MANNIAFHYGTDPSSSRENSCARLAINVFNNFHSIIAPAAAAAAAADDAADDAAEDAAADAAEAAAKAAVDAAKANGKGLTEQIGQAVAAYVAVGGRIRRPKVLRWRDDAAEEGQDEIEGSSLADQKAWESVRALQWALRSDRVITTADLLKMDSSRNSRVRRACKSCRALAAALKREFPIAAAETDNAIQQLAALGYDTAFNVCNSQELMEFMKTEFQEDVDFGRFF